MKLTTTLTFNPNMGLQTKLDVILLIELYLDESTYLDEVGNLVVNGDNLTQEIIENKLGAKLFN